MSLGNRISYLRKLKGLTQENLSRGIISSSHLSNIESGRYTPPSDIIHLLADKLEVDRNYLLFGMEDDINLNKYLNELDWLLEINNLDNAYSIYKKIKKEFPIIYSFRQELHFLLLELLIYTRNNQLENASDTLQNLSQLYDETHFVLVDNNKLLSLYYYTHALFSYYQKDYIKCSQLYLKQIPMLTTEKEKAKIYFNIALVFLKLKDHIHALTYGKSSLELYLLSHEMDKAIDVYIFLSVLYWENNRLELAEESIQNAKSLSYKFNLTRNLDKIYHNIGIINETKKDYYTALESLFKSLDLKIDNNKKNIGQTYSHIINILLITRDLDKANDLINEAMSFCTSDFDLCLINICLAKIHHYNKKYSEYERIMERSIQSLLNAKEYNELLPYAVELATYYEGQKKYKKVAYYYKLALYCKGDFA